ncbi:MAG TPA: hypothetical protein VHQ66_10880 [Myxococcota bacterium]|nr:hypothetical protein [Myxococcota bacterium]
MLQLPRNLLKRIALFLLALFFVAAGVTHFTNPEFFVAIVPPALPAPLTLVYVSGVFEILGGLAVLWPATRAAAGVGLVLLLLAVYPANLYMAFAPERFVAQGTPLWALYARLPVQFVFIAWAWWATRGDAAAAAPAGAAA